jgi:tRNA G37 N-methylase TrmD
MIPLHRPRTELYMRGRHWSPENLPGEIPDVMPEGDHRVRSTISRRQTRARAQLYRIKLQRSDLPERCHGATGH